MAKLIEMLDKYKAGTITFEEFQKWQAGVITKNLKTPVQSIDPKLNEKLERIAELEKTIDSLKNGTSKDDLQKIVDTLKKEYDLQLNSKDDEIARKTKSLDDLENKLTNKSLREIGLKIAKELGISKPEYAVDDLIRDGKLKMSKEDDGSGNISYNAMFDYEYTDNELKKKVKANFRGNESNIDELKKGFTILMTNETDYNRIKELYPIEKQISNGAGVKNGVSFSQDVYDPLISLQNAYKKQRGM